MSWFGRVLGALALGLVLGLLLALVVSNYSLTPGNAKFDLLLVTAIVAGALFKHAWQTTREMLRHRHPRKPDRASGSTRK